MAEYHVSDEFDEVDLANSMILVEAEGATEEIEVVEQHFHSKQRWYGKIADNDETNAIEDSLTPFRITSGVGEYGTEVCIVGSADILIPGKTEFDLHKILFLNSQKAELFKLKLAWGTGTHAEALLAGNYSTSMVNFSTLTGKTEGLEAQMPKIANGNKVWISCWSITNSQYVDLFVGGHGYI